MPLDYCAQKTVRNTASHGKMIERKEDWHMAIYCPDALRREVCIRKDPGGDARLSALLLIELREPVFHLL
jgi:hypothetical protein